MPERPTSTSEAFRLPYHTLHGCRRRHDSARLVGFALFGCAALGAGLLLVVALTRGRGQVGGYWTGGATYNAAIAWAGRSGAGPRRYALFPAYLNEPAHYPVTAEERRANRPNPAARQAGWSGHILVYGGRRISCPAGSNLVLIHPDGTAVFYLLPSKYVARENDGHNGPLDVPAMAADGLLPRWAFYGDGSRNREDHRLDGE